MKINVFLLCGALALTLLVIPFLLTILLKKERALLRVFLWILFLNYLATLFLLTILSVSLDYPNILILEKFDQPWLSLNFVLWGKGFFNALFNLSMFLPLGIFVFNITSKHRFLCTIFLAFGLSILIELLQFVLPVSRTTELADIVLGTLSGLLSAVFCFFVY